MSTRIACVGLALGLVAATPLALAQKMYKCSDGKGGTTFQQSPCAETAQEAEARARERERVEAEAARKKEEEARRKAEAIQKGRERDKAYQEQAAQRAEERKKAEEAEKRLLQGTALEGGPRPAAAAAATSDGSIAPELEQLYPPPWREGVNAGISDAFGKANVKCPRQKYRQRGGGGAGEFLVHCSADGKAWVRYFVWPGTGAVKGPYKA